MAADQKQLRSRIKSTRGTLQLTKAMGLVASSKLRGAMANMENSRAYAAAFRECMAALSAGGAGHPFCQERPGKTKWIVIAGDRGLAGGFNANVFRLAAEWQDAEILPIGLRACAKWNAPPCPAESFSFAQAEQWAQTLCAQFLGGEFARLGILSTRYRSILSQEAQIRFLLPLLPPKKGQKGGMLFEPNEETVFEKAVPQYLAGELLAAVQESVAAETTARRMAMDAAGKNAQQMIDALQLEYNRARQSAITQEITEIVAGGSEE